MAKAELATPTRYDETEIFKKWARIFENFQDVSWNYVLKTDNFETMCVKKCSRISMQDF